MIKFMNSWIQQIAVAVIITSIFEMIIPNGNIKKYVKVILGLYVVFSIISPFVKVKEINSNKISEAIESFSENITDFGSKVNNIQSEKNLDKIYKSTLEKEIIKTIEKEGFDVYKCNVKGVFDAEKNNAGIEKIDIVLKSEKKEKPKLNTEKKSLVKDVNQIKKVEINFENGMEELDKNKVIAKDVDTLKKFLSKHYEIEKSAIEIHIR